MPQTLWVWDCSGTKGEQIAALLSPAVMPTCAPASAGNWVQVTIPDAIEPEPSMDLITVGIAIAMCLMFAFGFQAGRTR